MLFSKNDAIQFVRECQKGSIKILGIDSFKIVAAIESKGFEVCRASSEPLKISNWIERIRTEKPECEHKMKKILLTVSNHGTIKWHDY